LLATRKLLIVQTLLVVGLFVMRTAWYLQTSAARQRTLKRA